MDEELYGSISALPQNRFLGGMANFMKFLEQEKPEFLPSQLDVMGLMRQLALPSSQTVENLSYGNSPFTMPPQGTGAMIPQVKTGRKAEVADLIGFISGGVPGAKAAADSGVKISQDALNAYLKMIRETPPIGAVNPEAFIPSGERVTRFSEVDYDPRFDPRVKEQPRIKETTTKVEQTANLDAPVVSLTEFEGYPFITSMSDRTAAGGLLTSINDVALKRPVELPGGQDYMFANPEVWASAKGPVNQIMNNAQMLREITGLNPLFIPWRMAPSGGDFAKFTGETMLAYAESALPKTTKKAIDKSIKNIFPDWKGLDSPEAIDQYRSLPDSKRKKIKKTLDVNFREEGGLGIGQARLAVTDPKQYRGSDAQIMNIGRIFADQPIIQQTRHASYPKGVPGEGIGRVDRDINIFQLLPKVVQERGIPSAVDPRQTDIRALQMKPYAGILDEETLRLLGY
jgi:hypothetical protein